jgi:hypothetical protein
MSATPLSYPPRSASLAATAVYQPRRPEKTVVYRVVQQHLETWLAQVRVAEPDSDPVPPFIERDFRQYLECGILADGNVLMQDLTPYPRVTPYPCVERLVMRVCISWP